MLIMIFETFPHCSLPLLRFLLHPVKSLYHVFTFSETWFSLKVSISVMVMVLKLHCLLETLGIFNKIPISGLPPEILIELFWVVDQVIPLCSLPEWWLLILCMYPKRLSLGCLPFNFNFFLGTISWILWKFLLLGATPAFPLIQVDFSPRSSLAALFKALVSKVHPITWWWCLPPSRWPYWMVSWSLYYIK